MQLPTERVAPPKDFRTFFEEEDGSKSTRSTPARAVPGRRAWSPDGKNIAFISYLKNLPTEKGEAPLMQLRTIELMTGNISKLNVDSVTGWNGPQWVSDGEILFNRYN